MKSSHGWLRAHGIVASMRIALVLLLAACGYRAGSFHDFFQPEHWDGTHVTLGCLDLAMTATTDVAVPDQPVVSFEFGNRCEHRVVVDLGAVHVVATNTHGQDVALIACDPRQEIHQAT